MVDTQNNSLTGLTKKIEILNTPLKTDRKRGIAILNITELLDNEKIDRHVRNIICYKCKEYGHCVGQFCPGLQQCKGKGPAQYLV